jgi:hypothetical protein
MNIAGHETPKQVSSDRVSEGTTHGIYEYSRNESHQSFECKNRRTNPLAKKSEHGVISWFQKKPKVQPDEQNSAAIDSDPKSLLRLCDNNIPTLPITSINHDLDQCVIPLQSLNSGPQNSLTPTSIIAVGMKECNISIPSSAPVDQDHNETTNDRSDSSEYPHHSGFHNATIALFIS